MSQQPEELANAIAKHAPHEILARYAVVLTIAICGILYGAGSIYYDFIDNALSGLSDRVGDVETYQLCNELRFASGSTNQCEVKR